MQVDCWHRLYNDAWQGLCLPAAFAHPAKFAKGLIFHIVDHALAEEWVRPGEICADPFGGVALGALPCLLKGINWFGCELEERFVDLGRQNLAYWQQRYGHRMQGAQAVLVQGDSRDLCAVLGKQVGMRCGSPPYAGSQQVDNRTTMPSALSSTWRKRFGTMTNGMTPDNLGNLPTGAVEAVISSPPYVDRCANDNQRTIIREGLQQGHNEGDGSTYGVTSGNLATLVPGQVEAVICSPPWTDQLVNHDTPEGYQALKDKVIASGNWHPGSFCLHGGLGYGKTPGNLGNLPTGHADAVISSPPYAEGLSKEHTYHDHAKRDKDSHRRIMTEKGIVDPHYGTTPGQLGNSAGETFWHAAAQILHQCFALLRPGGYAIFVTKAYVRDRALVPFPADWRRLCEHVGFRLRHEHHALLSKNHGREQSLFGGEEVTRETRRVSFFRRLSEKNGAPRIDYEVVHCFQKPD